MPESNIYYCRVCGRCLSDTELKLSWYDSACPDCEQTDTSQFIKLTKFDNNYVRKLREDYWAKKDKIN
jgi:hypothetical protein